MGKDSATRRRPRKERVELDKKNKDARTRLWLPRMLQVQGGEGPLRRLVWPPNSIGKLPTLPLSIFLLPLTLFSLPT